MKAQAYIICALPRSGSTLLCDLLASTGVAGRPASFYRSQSIPRWARRLNLSVTELADEKEFNRAYVAAVLRAGAGDTGLFGLRLMWESVEELSRRLDTLYPGLPDDAVRFERAFGPTRYVHLLRQDKVMQAVSRLKAIQTDWALACRRRWYRTRADGAAPGTCLLCRPPCEPSDGAGGARLGLGGLVRAAGYRSGARHIRVAVGAPQSRDGGCAVCPRPGSGHRRNPGAENGEDGGR